MLTKNKPDEGLVNGSRGIVIDFVELPNDERSPVVKFDNGRTMVVEKTQFLRLVPSSTDSMTAFRRKQIPLKLAWSLTVHKSQGATLSRAELAIDNAFACGQVYVALSRVQSMNGLWLKGKPLQSNVIKAAAAVLDKFS